MAYHYNIQKEAEGYTFRFYPNNSNTQEMGKSDLFPTEKECRNALNQFKSCGTLFRNNPDACEITQRGERFYFCFHYGSGNTFYSARGHEQKQNSKNAIKSIIKNIDAPLRID